MKLNRTNISIISSLLPHFHLAILGTEDDFEAQAFSCLGVPVPFETEQVRSSNHF